MSRVPFVLRALVRLCPPDFRDRYGESMLSFHRERLADATRRGESQWRVWRRTAVDIIVTAVLEWTRVLSLGRTTPNSYTSNSPSEERMSIIGQELVQSVRSLRRSAGFTLAAVITLALGISSTTAIFSVVH